MGSSMQKKKLFGVFEHDANRVVIGIIVILILAIVIEILVLAQW